MTARSADASGVDDVVRAQSALVSAIGVPFFEGNRIDSLRNGNAIFPAMLEAIESATSTIDLLTFVYWTGDIADRFAEALGAAATRGVRVRVLLDGWGALPMEDRLVTLMEEAGVDVRWFRPVSRWKAFWKLTHRTHRKVLICDHAVAFTGGVGIGKEWEGDARNPDEWRDTHFRIRGPAVRGLHSAFVGNWLEVAPEDGAITELPDVIPRAGTIPIQVIRSTASVSWSDLATLLRRLLLMANESIWISTPYFVPDEATARLLIRAAEAGVDVRVLLPGPYTDQRVAQVAGEAVYEDLLEGGVQLYEYQPTMIHQKITVVDSLIVSVGSGNLNHRSLLQDDEIQLTVTDPEFAGRMRSLLTTDLESAELVTPGQWKRRGVLQRAAEAVSNRFRSQM